MLRYILRQFELARWCARKTNTSTARFVVRRMQIFWIKRGGKTDPVLDPRQSMYDLVLDCRMVGWTSRGTTTRIMQDDGEHLSLTGFSPLVVVVAPGAGYTLWLNATGCPLNVRKFMGSKEVSMMRLHRYLPRSVGRYVMNSTKSPRVFFFFFGIPVVLFDLGILASQTPSWSWSGSDTRILP